MKKLLLLFLMTFSINSYCQTAGNGVTDIDGHTYNTVIIGTQEWTKENLTVSAYTDGTQIPQVSDPTAWGNLTTGAWCYYNNDPANGAIYGKLYNWYAVAGIYNVASLSNASLRKNLAPIGYHITTDGEWTTLKNYLGGESEAGGKMKETETAHWGNPNVNATNESGFSALPGGTNAGDGTFNSINSGGQWWCSTDYDSIYAWCFSVVNFNGLALSGYTEKNHGFSVRCIQGNTLSKQSLVNQSFKIYPNPTHSILNLSISDGMLLDKVTIVDVTGKIVLEQTENLSTINVEKMAKGVYIVTAYAGDKKYQEKFIKE